MSEEQIADDLISHSLDLYRLEASLRKDALSLLEKLRVELRGKLTDKNLTEFSKARLARLLSEADKVIGAYYLRIEKGTDEALGALPGISNEAVRASLIGVGLGPALAPATHFQMALGDVMIQGAPSSEWWKRQSADTAFRFANAVRSGIVQGKTNQEIVRSVIGGRGDQIEGILATSKRNATALVQTSVQTVANEARLESFRQNGDVIKAVKQLSTLDGHTTTICIAYSGMQWDLDGTPIAGNQLAFNGGPPRHWNCRSVLVPVTKTFRELGIAAPELAKTTRASADGPIAAGTTFDDFLKRRGVEYQDKMLGKGRADLWRERKITLQQLLDLQGNPVSLAELQAKYKVAQPEPKPPRAKPEPKAPTAKLQPKTKGPTAAEKKAAFLAAPSAATTQAEAEAWAVGNKLAKKVDYRSIAPEIANAINNSISGMLKEFPAASDLMKFVGTIQNRDHFFNDAKIIELTKNRYKATAHLETKEQAERSVRATYKPMPIHKSTNCWAQAWSDPRASGISINDYFSGDAERLANGAALSVDQKWHPVGTGSIKAVFDHECGHILDYALSLRRDPEIILLFEKATAEGMKDALSEYAIQSNAVEFIAEAWTEAVNNPNPRFYAREVASVIRKKYKLFYEN